MTDQLSTVDPIILRDLPPSAKIVVKTLEYEGDLTQSSSSHHL